MTSMLKTAHELLQEMGAAMRARRLDLHWSQAEAAERAGMGVRTWRRMEASGQASIENLVNAAIALRAERGLEELFPRLPASSMDELLKRQAESAKPRQRALRKKRA